jgi:hypothetical protein
MAPSLGGSGSVTWAGPLGSIRTTQVYDAELRDYWITELHVRQVRKCMLGSLHLCRAVSSKQLPARLSYNQMQDIRTC